MTTLRASPSRNVSSKPTLTISQIESRYPDVREKKTAVELRELRKQAVEVFDFDKSDAILAYLELLSTDISDSTIAEARVWLASCCQSAIGTFQSNLIELEWLLENRELHVRREIQSQFEELQLTHENSQIVPIEDKRQRAIHRAGAPSAAVLDLERKAKELALAGNGAEAREAKSQADALYDGEVATLTEAANQKFDAKQAQLAEVQIGQLKALEDKLKDMLDAIQSSYVKELKEQEAHLIVALKFHWRKAVNDVLAILETPSRRVELTGIFRQLLVDLLTENKMDNLVEQLD
jgi:hypothetical protein